jgi:beta-1,4-glucuronyltransferase 1
VNDIDFLTLNKQMVTMVWKLSCWNYVRVTLCQWDRTKIVVGILTVIILTAIQFVIIFIWINSPNTEAQRAHGPSVSQRINSITATFNAPVVSDSSGTYRIMKWIISPRLKQRFKSLNISGGETALVTQCSPDHFHLLSELRSAWEGPISVTVFAASSNTISGFVRLLSALQHCRPLVLDALSVHLVAPLTVTLPLVRLFDPSDNCSELDDLIEQHKNIGNYDSEVPYPNNLLRNVALDGAVSDYTFVIDIDMLPSANLFSQFRDFVRRSNPTYNTAYVVPAFEIRLGETVPKNRKELLQLWNTGIIQPFYRDVCWKCQRHTDYETWRNLSVANPDQVDVGYIVVWHDPWEPFYVVPHFTARYDERFKQYGFNRISQVCLWS